MHKMIVIFTLLGCGSAKNDPKDDNESPPSGIEEQIANEDTSSKDTESDSNISEKDLSCTALPDTDDHKSTPVTHTTSTLSKPERNRIIQVGASGTGPVDIEYKAILAADCYQIEKFNLTDSSGSSTVETYLPTSDNSPMITVNLKAGWHKISIRYFKNNQVIHEDTTQKFGIGNVFIVAGQSNSANHGSERLTSRTQQVFAWNRTEWQIANDPQPLATGGGGSPWPEFGDLMVEKTGMPIGILSVGVSTTTSKQWLPETVNYKRLAEVIRYVGIGGAKAILWHQGESDTKEGIDTETYYNNLLAIINQSQMDSGYALPWVIAGVAYIGAPYRTNENAIRSAQKRLVDDGFAFMGPTTDDLLGDLRALDGIHLSKEGLIEHAYRWARETYKLEQTGS